MDVTKMPSVSSSSSSSSSSQALRPPLFSSMPDASHENGIYFIGRDQTLVKYLGKSKALDRFVDVDRLTSSTDDDPSSPSSSSSTSSTSSSSLPPTSTASSSVTGVLLASSLLLCCLAFVFEEKSPYGGRSVRRFSIAELKENKNLNKLSTKKCHLHV